MAKGLKLLICLKPNGLPRQAKITSRSMLTPWSIPAHRFSPAAIGRPIRYGCVMISPVVDAISLPQEHVVTAS